MSRLTILYKGKILETDVTPGVNLLTALQQMQIPVHAPCAGMGRCKKCRVKLTQDGHTRPVLACTTIVTQDCAVEIPEKHSGNILQHAEKKHGAGGPPRPKAPFARPGYGIAVDLGTTTVVVQLYLLAGGKKPLGTVGEWNAQASYGADVISRAHYCMTHSNGLEELSHVIRSQVFRLAEELCKKHRADYTQLFEVAVAGNTIMQHIFAGIDPSSIAVAPYHPKTLFLDEAPQYYPECPQAGVRFAPCVAGYVGGDITSGLLYCELTEEPGISLFLDVGTNGEMALCNNGRFFCCSVACGPAFEGAEISCGMSATAGAISHVFFDNGKFYFDVIGNVTPVGLCGSGLIDLLSILLDLEVVDETGRLLPPDEVPDSMMQYVTEDANGNGEFHLTDQVCFTAGDVRKLQLAKAAVAAGIEMLLQEADIKPEQVDTLFLAGGFGDNLHPDSARRTGLIPDNLSDKIFCVGNSSLSGVRQMLLAPPRQKMLLEIQRNCSYLELSGNQKFSNLYIENMMFEDE